MNAKPIIHFAHANGFPASSYNKLFAYLKDDFGIIALEKFAHNPAFPLSQDWQNQVAELVDYIDTKHAQPCYLVGHSFGAVVSYMAACQNPEKFLGLIMLDPPLVTGLTSLFARSVRNTRLFDNFTPAKQTLNRCTAWPKGVDLVEYFQAKTLFKDMHPQCVEDYVAAATIETDEGHKLDFDHQVEANIFRTVPLNISRYYGKLTIPSLLITGEQTKVCTEKLIAPFIRHNKLAHKQVARGGHMFPLEQPEHVSILISEQIHLWENQRIAKSKIV
ncbi:alpha/beta hydrolase [Aliiglaciecola sp. LCG003]|uniref:alpha/beta fold hydrolase n=1 Tax=Aliiglaciecola sp. LCG003 TaxID=3053655 RepID=UPI0025728009|nr:alpha/beta hydrolase [Aliiglaciecola sp. LCG003]WJG07918.1 alpha/beta hydrolase [Aliiglaciecola sp. LCG003]